MNLPPAQFVALARMLTKQPDEPRDVAVIPTFGIGPASYRVSLKADGTWTAEINPPDE